MLKILAALTLGATVALSSPAEAQQGAGNALTQFAGSMAPMPDPAGLSVKGAVYVPAYSSIRSAGAK